jgi:hypothetical protein
MRNGAVMLPCAAFFTYDHQSASTAATVGEAAVFFSTLKMHAIPSFLMHGTK